MRAASIRCRWRRSTIRLADRILPALTVRMRRIRFVTAMCVAARVCDGYEIDDVATDDVTPPWLVFEWFVVEALVRHKDELDDAEGVPGGLKVASARRRGHAVSHASYLKTPKVFGFSGIFRRFATQAGVLTDDLTLDDGGHAILAAWEADLGPRVRPRPAAGPPALVVGWRPALGNGAR